MEVKGTIKFTENGFNQAMDTSILLITKCFFISGLPDEMQKEIITRKSVN